MLIVCELLLKNLVLNGNPYILSFFYIVYYETTAFQVDHESSIVLQSLCIPDFRFAVQTAILHSVE